MKIFRVIFPLAACLVLAVSPVHAAKKPKPPSLDKLISTPQHLKEFLGQKTLLLPYGKTSKIASEVAKVIQDSKLDQATQFFLLPDNATEPEAKTRHAPRYPSDLRRNNVSGSAKFLMLIGSDGTIKSLYCYESSHPALALAAAEALASWKYKPAMIEGTAVPVLVSQMLEFYAN